MQQIFKTESTLDVFKSCCSTLANNLAKVKPLFIKGSKTNPSNSRPISLLPLISKNIGKLILYKTSRFLSNNEILYNYQSGFRKNHSADSCLAFLHHKNLNDLDKGLMTGTVLVDLQKAFETIDPDILLTNWVLLVSQIIHSKSLV